MNYFESIEVNNLKIFLELCQSNIWQAVIIRFVICILNIIRGLKILFILRHNYQFQQEVAVFDNPYLITYKGGE